jgi:hypothetical protein
MHASHQPTEQTLFEMQGALLRLPANVTSQVRWRGADLAQITRKSSAVILDLLREAAGFESLFTRRDPSPWNGVELRSGKIVEQAVDLASRLHQHALPNLKQELRELVLAHNFRVPGALPEVQEILELVNNTFRLQHIYESEVFSDANTLLEVLSLGKTGGLKPTWLRITNGKYRSTYNKCVELRRGAKTSGSELFREFTDVLKVKEKWQQWNNSGSAPLAAKNTDSCKEAYRNTQVDLDALQAICRKLRWSEQSIDTIEKEVTALADDTVTPYKLLRLSEIEQQLYSLGVQRVVDEIRKASVRCELWGVLFQYVWLHSTLDEAASKDPHVRGFVGSTHTGFVEDFKKLDSDRLKIAGERVRRAHAERTISAMNDHPEQEHLIRAEASKMRRHRPLRRMFKEAGDVLTAVCPCWMASPLSVSQLVDATGTFDYVIFDEASQVLPEDAIPAILRGKHVIVAGDNKQLPPSAFFSASEDEEGEGEAEGYESLLDIMIPFVKSFYLNWHYRSRDEALIAFSNHHIYDDRLVTFPGPGGRPAISHVS